MRARLASSSMRRFYASWLNGAIGGPFHLRQPTESLTRLVVSVEPEQPEQVADLMSGLGAVPHLHVAVDDVAASSSGSLALQANASTRSATMRCTARSVIPISATSRVSHQDLVRCRARPECDS